GRLGLRPRRGREGDPDPLADALQRGALVRPRGSAVPLRRGGARPDPRSGHAPTPARPPAERPAQRHGLPRTPGRTVAGRTGTRAANRMMRPRGDATSPASSDRDRTLHPRIIMPSATESTPSWIAASLLAALTARAEDADTNPSWPTASWQLVGQSGAWGWSI